VSFFKKSGELRNMKFVKLSDIPSTLLPKKKTEKTILLREGSELVFDVEKNGFRMINWKTVMKQEEREITLNELEDFLTNYKPSV
jgi:hypothetical protein